MYKRLYRMGWVALLICLAFLALLIIPSKKSGEAEDLNSDIQAANSAQFYPQGSNEVPSNSILNRIDPEVYNQYYNRSIDFWGRIVDQDSNPIAGVKVAVTLRKASLLLNIVGQLHHENSVKYTDEEGYFRVADPNTEELIITEIAKPGFIAHGAQAHIFRMQTFGSDNASKNAPFQLYMWKATAPQTLVKHLVGHRQLRPTNAVWVVNLFPDNSNYSNDLRITYHQIDDNSNEWKIECTALEGELQLITNQFAFFAPLEGYVDSVTLTGIASSDKHGEVLERSYYVRIRESKLYGICNMRLSVEPISMVCTLNVSAIINPNRNRSLEPAEYVAPVVWKSRRTNVPFE